jgi:hypothetical protein
LHHDFCTLFDAKYLSRGLSLHRSLAASCESFRLRALCMDDASLQALRRLDLPGLEPVALAELEAHDPQLAAVRATRSPVEYCWTTTPALCLYCLEREPGLELITYVDADVLFYRDPAPAFDEFGDGSVLIVPHRYADRWTFLERDSGVYNVQFVSFRRDEQGLATLRSWREQCLDWCYARVEDGRYGDQLYLDAWPAAFPGVRVLQNPGAGLGPWSSGRFHLERTPDGITVDGEPLLFHHFHGLRLYRSGPLDVVDRAAGAQAVPGVLGLRWSSDFPLTTFERDEIWAPYVSGLAADAERVEALVPHAGVGEPLRPGLLVRRTALRLPGGVPAGIARVQRLVERVTRGSGPALALACLLI